MMAKGVNTSLDYFTLQDISSTRKNIILGKDFKLIPENIFSNVLDVVIYYAKQRLEVLFYIYYDHNNNYVITVPRQKVNEYKIKVFDRTDIINYQEVDLISNKIVNTNKLIKLGSIHSHHVLKAEFSLDDDISDFNAPPGLHILLGEFPNIKVITSIAYMNKRYYLNPTSIIDYSAIHYLDSNKKIDDAISKQIIKY